MHFKAEHNKIYASPEEHNYRLGVFHKNTIKINQINSLNDFVAKVNKFADLTEQEFRAKYLGKKRGSSTGRTKNLKIFDHKAVTADPPKSVDLRTLGIVNPVKDQGACGSCWTFSTIEVVETKFYQTLNTTW